MYESRYTDIIAHEYYLLDLELQQADMTRYVNECVILSGTDKRKAIEEMAIFNEGALGDKFKKVWARIKSFFAKIYQKFLESLQAWASDNITYLKQYGNIILEKKCKIANAKMQNHFNGMKLYEQKLLPNVKTIFTTIPDFTELEKISNTLANITKETDKVAKGQEAVDAYTLQQQNVVAKALTGNDNDSDLIDSNDTAGFGGRIRNWLNGGETVEDFSGSDLEEHMETMYNFLYRYDATVEGLKKIKDAFDQGMTNIETSYKKGFDEMKKKVKDDLNNGDNAKIAKSKAAVDADNVKKSDTLGQELKNVQDDAKKASAELKRQPQNSAYSYVYGRVISEAETTMSTGSNSTTSTVSGGGAGKDTKNLDTANKSDRQSSSETSKTVKADATTGKTVGTGAGASAAVNIAGQTGVKNEDLENYETNALSMVRAWGNARSICMGAALNMLSDTRKDYMDIIRAHVRSWVGQTAGPDQNVEAKPSGNVNRA